MKQTPVVLPKRGTPSFTLIELLTVIAIIALLAALSLSAMRGAQLAALRSRTKTEIQGLSGALENFKADNGSYPIPPTPYFSTTNDYMVSPASSSAYLGAAEFLYEQLSGNTAVGYTYNLTPTPAAKVYFTFNHSQLGNGKDGATGPVYVQDPYGNPYGYFNGNGTAVPYNGTNQFDVWSTAGDANNPPVSTVGWVDNWGN